MVDEHRTKRALRGGSKVALYALGATLGIAAVGCDGQHLPCSQDYHSNEQSAPCRVGWCKVVSEYGSTECAAKDAPQDSPCNTDSGASGTCQEGLCVEGTGGSGGTPELCSGGEDEDGDELVDCEDVQDCACAPNCVDQFLNDCQPTNLLTNPGFEQGPGGSAWTGAPGFPTSADIWGGDLADVVESVSPIDPLTGTYMMQFESTFDQPDPTASASSERVQLVDDVGLFVVPEGPCE